MAAFWKTTDNVVATCMDMDQTRGIWVVVGADKNIRVSGVLCVCGLGSDGPLIMLFWSTSVHISS